MPTIDQMVVNIDGYPDLPSLRRLFAGEIAALQVHGFYDPEQCADIGARMLDSKLFGEYARIIHTDRCQQQFLNGSGLLSYFQEMQDNKK
jgi:hypothetical protein